MYCERKSRSLSIKLESILAQEFENFGRNMKFSSVPLGCDLLSLSLKFELGWRWWCFVRLILVKKHFLVIRKWFKIKRQPEFLNFYKIKDVKTGISTPANFFLIKSEHLIFFKYLLCNNIVNTSFLLWISLKLTSADEKMFLQKNLLELVQILLEKLSLPKLC